MKLFLLLCFCAVSWSATKQEWTQFEQWFVEGGVKGFSSNFFLRESFIPNGGSGLFATRDFEKDEVILEVPKALIISNRTVQNSEYWDSIFNTKEFKEAFDSDILNDLIIVFSAIQLCDPNSAWSPYWKVVSSDSHLPVLWTADELDLLDNTTLSEYMAELQAALRLRTYYFETIILPKLPPEIRENCDTSDYMTAVALFISRGLPPGLVPVADFLNHGFGGPEDEDDPLLPPGPTPEQREAVPESQRASVTWDFNDETLMWIVRAIRKINAGDELRVTYGPKDGNEFLVSYATVPSPNPFECFRIRLGNDPKDGRGTYTKCLRKDFFATRSQDQILSDCRRYFNPEELEDNPVLPFELLCLRRFRDRLSEMENLFSHSLKEDLGLLKTNDITYRQRLALEYRASQKRILRALKRSLHLRIRTFVRERKHSHWTGGPSPTRK